MTILSPLAIALIATTTAMPAAELQLIPVSSTQMQGHMHGADHKAAPQTTGPEVTLGDLTLSGGFSRATLPGAPVAGGFFTVTNTGSTADRLVGVTSPAANRMEVHEMAMQGDVMVMRPLPDGLEIPAGATVTLKPGSYHLMFMELNGPLKEGETVPVTLPFEKAGEVTLPLAIGAPNAGGHH